MNHKSLVLASVLGSVAAIVFSMVIGAAYGSNQLNLNNKVTSQAGVPITATRYLGTIHDFMMLNPIFDTTAARLAIDQAGVMLKKALSSGALIGAAISATSRPEQAPFLAEIEAAMKKMMAAMDIKPSGDVDRDFVAMMVPHHQGAIDMAKAELLYGSNEQLRRIAQEIVVEQQQEIAAMRLALGEPVPPSSVSPPDQSSPSSCAGQTSMQQPPTFIHLYTSAGET